MAAPITLDSGTRSADVRAAVQIEIVTVLWMLAEAFIAIGAGLLAGSVVLIAFGADSAIELVSAAALLWRLSTEAGSRSLERVERAEQRAAWIAGTGLVLLCVYVLAGSALSLLTHHEAERSYVGIALAVAALLVMPILFQRKRAIAGRIGSAALRADAACSLTRAYMAGTLLLGLALNATLGWWWIDSLAALALLYWIIPEARGALEAARGSRSGCGCGDAHCDA